MTLKELHIYHSIDKPLLSTIIEIIVIVQFISNLWSIACAFVTRKFIT